MIIGVIILGVLITALGILLRAINNAPTAWQDGDGFHFGVKDETGGESNASPSVPTCSHGSGGIPKALYGHSLI